MATSVIKIGGSVLALPDLSSRLLHLLRQFPGEDLLLVIGGGHVTNVVREWDQVHRLGDEAAHWLAIESLGLTARLVAHLIDAQLIRTRDEAAACWNRNQVAIADVSACVRMLESGSALDLPHSWDATSDSIAAWIAAEWPADRLVLVKSIDLSGPLDELARRGSVDAAFPTLAARLKQVLWCNLTGDGTLTPLAAESGPTE